MAYHELLNLKKILTPKRN